MAARTSRPANHAQGHGRNTLYQHQDTLHEDDENFPSRGPRYNASVWNYYISCGAWSDGLCASLQRPALFLQCCCPLVAVYRLYLTLHRSAPLDLGLANLKVESAGRARALTMVVTLCISSFVVGAVFCVLTRRINLTVLVLLFCCLVAGASIWAALLVAVGRKFKVGQVVESPFGFFLKSCCCLCAMNVRVGLHVDRAQGFTKPQRSVAALAAQVEMPSRPNRHASIL
eukprot:TRINITY_DN52116_c0_g1_i1.p1 TRINITY_DN52116_c0_g1~~TRINITY_DN52116_c0_g1_i1.p1  ORF type:complete len:267 (+),score=11.28 TRINITY_DN52116_c0_g1_i1:116-802(+)